MSILLIISIIVIVLSIGALIYLLYLNINKAKKTTTEKFTSEALQFVEERQQQND